jgi:hypothetical protein
MVPDVAVIDAAQDSRHPATARPSHIAVVLVHGIGDLRAGSVTKAACDGLRKVFGDLEIGATERLATSPETAGATLHRTPLRYAAATIELIEFHWADVSGKIRLLRPLKAIRQTLGVVREFPSMAVDDRSSRPLRWLASIIGMSFALLLSIWGIVLTGSLIELSLWPGLWLKEVSPTEVQMFIPTDIIFSATLDPLFLDNGYYWSYAAQIVALVMIALPVVLTFAFVFVMALALVRQRLHPLSILLRTSAASGAFTFLLLFSAALLYVEGVVFMANVLARENVLALLLIAVVYSAITLLFLMASVWVGNLLRDVVHYLGTGRGGGPLSDRERTRTALSRAIGQLRELATVNRVVIVCHSLGTVVVVDLLRHLKQTSASGRAVPIDLVTAGSPMRRLIVRLLPHRLPNLRTLRSELASGALPVGRWFNAYRSLDFVGMRLVSGEACRDPERGILECPLVPRWQRPWGHSNYWADPRFTRLVAERVVAPIL